MQYNSATRKRDEKIYYLRNRGWTYKDIGQIFGGLSKQRIEILYNNYLLSLVKNAKIDLNGEEEFLARAALYEDQKKKELENRRNKNG